MSIDHYSRVEEAIESMGLDDRASELLRSMHPEEAEELLESLVVSASKIKNPSAYITKAANDRAHGKQGPAGQSLSRRVSDAIHLMGLDDRATAAVRLLEPAQALELIDTIPPSVRNPSAYLTKAAFEKSRGGKGASGASRAQMEVRDAIRSMGLDDRASDALRAMDPTQALELLDSIPPTVRNASAYITKAANDWMHQTGAPPRSQMVHRSSPAMPVMHMAPPRSRPREESRRAAELEAAIDSLRLDEKASGRLRSLDPIDALTLLDSMDRNVRNPSAFITKACNDRAHGKGDVESRRSSHMVYRDIPVQPVVHMAPPRKRPREDSQKAAELEAAIESLGLDDKASQRLRSLEPMDAVALLDSLDDNVRNPSAFITKAVNDRAHGKVDVESRRWSQITAVADDLGLDERAQQVLKELPATEAYRVVDNLKEKGTSIRNPSAFVIGAVAGIQKEMDPSFRKRRKMA